MYKKMFNSFYNAISDEISIEKDILQRLNKTHLTFVPLRGIKTLALIEKYKISRFAYSLLCLFFVLFSPLYFFIKLLRNIELQKNNLNTKLEENLILVANGRVDSLYNKLNKEERVSYININQQMKKTYTSYKSFLNFIDYIKAYFLALFSIFYLLVKLNNKTDILQAYVSYDWFLVYISLNKIRVNVKKIYFANHYDRWAVMFDQLFEDKEVALLQHGILPDDLELEYKLENIDIIYCYDEKSRKLFKKIFNAKNIKFESLKLSLDLSEINSDKKTILIIGQPHSMDKEIEIIKQLKNEYEVYIKPHPLYSDEKYKRIKDVNIIDEINFYPKVNLALCYESTLGLEYEASGVDVFWWKGMNMNEITINIKLLLGEVNNV